MSLERHMPANCGGNSTILRTGWLAMLASDQRTVGWQAAAGATSPASVLTTVVHSRCLTLSSESLQGATPGDIMPHPHQGQ